MAGETERMVKSTTKIIGNKCLLKKKKDNSNFLQLTKLNTKLLIPHNFSFTLAPGKCQIVSHLFVYKDWFGIK